MLASTINRQELLISSIRDKQHQKLTTQQFHPFLACCAAKCVGPSFWGGMGETSQASRQITHLDEWVHFCSAVQTRTSNYNTVDAFLFVDRGAAWDSKSVQLAIHHLVSSPSCHSHWKHDGSLKICSKARKNKPQHKSQPLLSRLFGFFLAVLWILLCQWLW